MPVRGRTAGNKGQGSKWIRRATRLRIYARDGCRCVWCGRDVRPGIPGQAGSIVQVGSTIFAVATLDHVVPREHGGSNKPHNLITACMQCNRERGSDSALLFAWRGNRQIGPAEMLYRIIQAIESPLPARKAPE